VEEVQGVEGVQGVEEVSVRAVGRRSLLGVRPPRRARPPPLRCAPASLHHALHAVARGDLCMG
jgi:hypothetical protein